MADPSSHPALCPTYLALKAQYLGGDNSALSLVFSSPFDPTSLFAESWTRAVRREVAAFKQASGYSVYLSGQGPQAVDLVAE